MGQKLLWLALAGACGTLARYGLGGWVQRMTSPGFPWGTLAVNITGCFLFGLIWALAQQRLAVAPEVRTIVLVGFLGAFTTFSSLVFETEQLMAQSEWVRAALNVFGSLAAGLAAYLAGAWLGRPG